MLPFDSDLVDFDPGSLPSIATSGIASRGRIIRFFSVPDTWFFIALKKRTELRTLRSLKVLSEEIPDK